MLLQIIKITLMLCVFPMSQMISQVSITQDFQKNAPAYFNKVVESLGIPGFGISVTLGEETVISEGYGYADLENKVEANGDTDYYIASSTKSFTALLAVLVDKEGIIKLSDPLSKYFSKFDVDASLDFEQIKIQDLLTHTSGMRNEAIGWRVAFTGEHDHEHLMSLMRFSEPNDVGYGNYQYTNVGYNIYTLILEEVTGKSWQNWMQEKILGPASMAHTTPFMSKAESEHWSLAKPYIVTDETMRIELMKKDNTMQSAGGLISTPYDMAKWVKIQNNMGMLDGKQVFPKDVIAFTHQKLVSTPEAERIFDPTNYGMGWLIGSFAGKEVIHHFGGFAGFSTHVSLMPEEQIGVCIMINEALAGNRLMNLISEYVYDFILHGKEVGPAHDEKLGEFTEMANQYRSQISANIKEREARTWQLTDDFSEYAGVFSSEEYGNMSIKSNASGLDVSIGNLACASTPFTNQNSIRVELVPGRGQVIQFVKEGDAIVGLQYDGMEFKRVLSR